MYQMEESRSKADIRNNAIQNKDKNDVVHIPSGKKFKFADIKLSGMIENISQARGKIHPFDNANCVQRKEGKCSEGMHDGVLQMVREEAVKLVASSFGKCPFTEIGLTVHHIIPDELIAQFYNAVKDRVDVQKEFHDWQNAAKEVEAADEGMSPTEIQSQHKDAKRTKKAETADKVQESYCHWMYGNVFIGPDSALRIDDKGAKFDEGAYMFGGEQLNGEVDNLKVLYDGMRRFVDNKTMDTEELKGILNRLTNVAKRNTTLHNDLTKTDLPNNEKFAYDVRKWMNVGESIADDKINEEIREDFVQKPAEIEKWKKITKRIRRILICKEKIQTIENRAITFRDDFCRNIAELEAKTDAEIRGIENKDENMEKIEKIEKQLSEMKNYKELFDNDIEEFKNQCKVIVREEANPKESKLVPIETVFNEIKATSEETAFDQTYNELLDNGKIDGKQGPMFISSHNYNILNERYMKIDSADIDDKEGTLSELESHILKKEKELNELQKNNNNKVELNKLMSDINSNLDSMRDFSGFGELFL